MSSILPPGEYQYCDENGDPYAGGTITFYIPGTLTLKNTYQDSASAILNTNPVVLDSAGRAVIWGTGMYQMQLNDSLGNLIWSRTTASGLSESAISSFMMSVVGATSALGAMTNMGVIAYVQNAISNIQLLPGPVGPQGAASTVPGPQGPAGASGSDGSAGGTAAFTPEFGAVGSYSRVVPYVGPNPPMTYTAGDLVDGTILTWLESVEYNIGGDTGSYWDNVYPTANLTGTWRVMETNINGGPWLCLRIS